MEGALSRLRDAWARVFGESDDRELLRAFAASRDPQDLPALLRVVLGRDAHAAHHAAAAISAYLGALGPRELLALDETSRQRYWWFVGARERQIEPADVPRLREHGAAALGLASFHMNGFVREAAVRELAETKGGAELPYLLVRVNDWVEAVQDAAYAAVRARLVPRYAAHFVRDLWLLARLERCARADHAALLGTVQALLVGPGWRPALRDALSTPDRWVRRSCYSLLLDAPAPDGPEILQRALRDEDAIVRLRAIRAAHAVLGVDRLRAVLPAPLRDPAMPVRREALALLTRHFPHEAEPALREALFDTHAPMREVARFDLRRRGITDFRTMYRSALDELTGARLKTALFGLGETGSAEDAPRVEKFLSHPTPAVRRAAVVGLARLAPEDSVPLFIRALEDTSPRVSRAARLALRPHRIGPAHLWNLVAREEPHVRANAFVLLAGLGKWESIGWMIRALAVDDERLASLARQRVSRWIDQFNRDLSRPSADQLERMARALDGAALDPKRERMLRFLMKGYD